MKVHRFLTSTVRCRMLRYSFKERYDDMYNIFSRTRQYTHYYREVLGVMKEKLY